jgi:hypothetical protein
MEREILTPESSQWDAFARQLTDEIFIGRTLMASNFTDAPCNDLDDGDYRSERLSCAARRPAHAAETVA